MTSLGILERRKIRHHLSRVETELRATDTSRRGAETRRAREANLDRLREYGVAGRFPRNTYVPDRRVPILRDARGVPCAVAYLIDASGRAELVDELARADNHIRIPDVRDGPLLAWIEGAGLTKDEAARIQPTYDPQLDLQLFVTTLLAVFAPLKVLAGALADRLLPLSGRRRFAARSVLAVVLVLLSTGAAMQIVVAYSPTYGDPFAAVFRTSLVAAFVVILLPIELVSLWLLDALAPSAGRRRVGVEAYLALANVGIASVIAMNVVWIVADILR